MVSRYLGSTMLNGFTHGAAIAAATSATVESLGEVTQSTTGYHDTATLSIAAEDIEPNSAYVLVWSQDVQGSSVTSEITSNVELNGSNQYAYEPTFMPVETAPLDWFAMGGLLRYQSGATPPAITVKGKFKRGTNASTIKARNARLSLVKLSDNSQWYENTSLQTFSNTTTNKNWQTVGQITLDPGGATKRWIVVGYGIANKSVAASSDLAFSMTDGTTWQTEMFQRPANATEKLPMMMAYDTGNISSAKTIQMTMRQPSAGTAVISIAEVRLWAICVSDYVTTRFVQPTTSSEGTQTAYTATQMTQTFTPAAARHFTLSAWGMGTNNNGISSQSRFVDNGVTLNEHVRESTTGTVDRGTWSISHKIEDMTAASRTQVVQRLSESGTATTRIIHYGFILNLDLTAA